MRTRLVVLVALLALPSPFAQAQPAWSGRLDPRWSAWVGCWTPAAGAGTGQDVRVCIVPAPDRGGVQMVSFNGDRELLTELLVADGSPQRLAERGCSGERTSRWAAAAPRLFSSSVLTCPNEPALATTSMSALVAADQWIDVQVVKSGDREQVNTRRFWRSSDPAPSPVAEAIGPIAPARPIITAVTVDDVIETSRMMPSIGVEAWLAESGTRVGVDRRALVRLSDAHVGTAVIDLMVAMAYPQKFEVRRGSGGGGGFLRDPFDDGFYTNEWGYLAGAFGYGLGYPYWIGTNYYYGPGGIYVQPGGGGGAPAGDSTHGQVVNGLGYTRVQPREGSRATSSGGGAGTASSAGGGPADSGSSSSGSSSGGVSSSGYSGGGGSTSTGLTAVPR